MDQAGRGGGEGAVATAFEASERARARGLRDLLTEARAAVRAGVEPELLAAAERLRTELVAQERVRTALVEARTVNETQLGKVRAAIADRLDEYKALEARLRARHPGFAALTQPAAPRTAEIQALLGTDTLLLEYALGVRRSWLFVVTAGSVEAFPLPARAQIEAHAARLHQRLSQGQQRAARAAVSAAAAELARLVLGPVRRRIAGLRLAIVADGALHYVPFAALPGSDGVPLLARHEIVQLPSAATLGLLRNAHGGEAAPRTVAVLADPVLEADDRRLGRPGARAMPSALLRALDDTDTAFTRLEFTAREAEAIARLAPAEGRLLATGFEASRATALSPVLADYRFVHFATHGLLDSRQPELSGIVLSMFDREGRAQDGFLRLHDVYNLSLRADLVVLSACRTALGQDLRGEGLVGLTRGFMYAGAPRVVASLWDVRDEATAELMKHFYSGLLRQRLTPAAALRTAQLALQRTPRWSAPYYWAAFTLQGDWR
ncbi:MAG: CHAT domain-containing protein [Vicinamibacteria bacterium]|nr:CHAT domain-containing protein [Vicinamibacteria bacterium]